MVEYFEKGYHIDRYHSLEEDLLSFLDYVTLEFYPKPQNQKYIKSIYLADLMLRIGSNISVFFDKFIESYAILGENRLEQIFFAGEESRKIIVELKAIKKKNSSNPKWQGWNWGDYKKLDTILALSDKHVLLIPLNQEIYPFKLNGKREGKAWIDIETGETRFWWGSYNKIKHNAAFKEANLNNVLHALAALFLLITTSGSVDSNKLSQYNYYKRDNRGAILAFDVSTRLFSRNIWG